MQFEIVHPNWTANAIKVIIYLILALMVVVLAFPVSRHVSDISFKVILVMIFIGALMRLFSKPYMVVGIFELDDSGFRILIDGVMREIKFSEVTKMCISLVSYYGMSVGLSLQVRHGIDNMVEIFTRQSQCSFAIRFPTIDKMDQFESRLRRLDSQINDLSIRRNFLST